MSPGLSPAAAAMAAKLLGNWAAFCSAADSPDADTITWPPPLNVAARDVGVMTMCSWPPALLASEWRLTADGLSTGELAMVVTMGVVEMTEAVLVMPMVVPLRVGGGVEGQGYLQHTHTHTHTSL